MPAPARMYVAALRPKTLTAALVPYLVGGALGTKAAHASAWGNANMALLGYLLVQVGTNRRSSAAARLSTLPASGRHHSASRSKVMRTTLYGARKPSSIPCLSE